MTNNTMTKSKYDLEERTAKFGEEIIKFAKKIPENSLTKSLIQQLIKAGTSIGANYCEADDAESKKEARETKHWLRMTVIAIPNLKQEARKLWQEVKELNLIFNAIIHSSKK